MFARGPFSGYSSHRWEQHVPSSGQHSIGLQFVGKPWEQLRSIPVDREGEYIFTLRPRTEKYPHRLLCEVKVVDTVKVVTIRSTYKIENLTLYPLEITLVDDTGHPVQSLEKIAPGQDYSLPIEAVTLNKIRIQPDRETPASSVIRFLNACRGLWLQVVPCHSVGRTDREKKLYRQMSSY